MATKMSSSGRAYRVLGGLVVTLCVVLVFAGIFKDLEAVKFDHFEWSYLWRALAVLPVAYVLRAAAFGVVVRSMDQASPVAASMWVYLIAQVGKYIPGKVWQVAGAGYFGAKFGTAPQASVVASACFMVIHLSVGSLLGLLVVSHPVLSSNSVHNAALVGVLGLCVVAFAASPLLPKLLHWIGQKTGKNLDIERVPLLAVLLTVATSLCVWILFGVAVVDVFRSVLPAYPPPDLITATAGMAAAAVAGFAIVVAPSGLGVREAVFVAVFSGAYSAAGAGVAAIAMRLIMSVVEVVLALIGLAWGRRFRRSIGA